MCERVRRYGRLLLCIAVFLGGVGSATAAPPESKPREASAPFVCPVCSRAMAENAGYPQKAGYTLARGATNALLGWTELIQQPANEAKRSGNLLLGLAKGIGHTVTRTLGGAAEVLTFWTPKIQESYVHFADDCPICARPKP